jgi:hypothetical protein
MPRALKITGGAGFEAMLKRRSWWLQIFVVDISVCLEELRFRMDGQGAVKTLSERLCQ